MCSDQGFHNSIFPPRVILCVLSTFVDDGEAKPGMDRPYTHFYFGIRGSFVNTVLICERGFLGPEKWVERGNIFIKIEVIVLAILTLYWLGFFESLN